jgi:hypothetical protein
VSSGQFIFTKLSGYHIHTKKSRLDHPKMILGPFEKITFLGQTPYLHDEDPKICPVQAAYRAFFRACKLNNKNNTKPMAMYLNKLGQKKYLMAGKIAEILQLIASTTHPDLTLEENKQISSHSGRVWAIVLLDQAGK